MKRKYIMKCIFGVQNNNKCNNNEQYIYDTLSIVTLYCKKLITSKNSEIEFFHTNNLLNQQFSYFFQDLWCAFNEHNN